MMRSTDVRRQQLELLKRLAALNPAPFLMGGFAEDALLYGGFSRDHADIDVMVERSGLDGLIEQFAALGYDGWESWGDTAAGEPFYLARQSGGILVDIGVVDRDGAGNPYLEIGHLYFEIAGKTPPVGYRVMLPADLFDYPPVAFEGIPVRTISPLANFQLRAGIASRGSFGELRPKDRASMNGLQARFFAGLNERELLPKVVSITTAIPV